MDNGHTNPPDNLLKFPTPNNVEANDNLDLSNPETSWDQPISTEHDKKAIGSSALNPVELSMPPSVSEATPPLGEITEHSLQPEAAPKLYKFPSQQTSVDKETDANIVKDSLELGPIKATESLNEAGIKRVNQEVQEFQQTGDAARLNRNVRSEMMPELMQGYETPNWTAVQPKTTSEEKRAA